MNKIYFPKWKLKIIKWLVGKKPLVLNFQMFGRDVPPGKAIIYYPVNPIKAEDAQAKAFLVPTMLVKDEASDE